MILITFRQNNEYRLGIRTDTGILDVAIANQSLRYAGLAETPQEFFSIGSAALPGLIDFSRAALEDKACAGWLLDEAAIEFGPCVPFPGKIICVGLNYRNHARESGLEPPKVPVLFAKYQNALAAHREPIPLPARVKKFDYEAELAVVIGRRARYVSEKDALSVVLGYCNANDVSERELQGITSQWLLGKSLDKFLPLGPYLMTADQAGDPQGWPVRCWLNGELRQNSNTSDMIFSVAKLVSFISQYMTLLPGDIISTGTPEGVILGKPQPRSWMKAGDEMTVEIGPLGRLTNLLVNENSLSTA